MTHIAPIFVITIPLRDSDLEFEIRYIARRRYYKGRLIKDSEYDQKDLEIRSHRGM